MYSTHVAFSNDMMGIDMRKSKLLLNKQVYTGMTILDNSKILMDDFFYNKLKKQYGPRCELLYTDTDSLLLEIETDDVYKDIEADKNLYDTSYYPKEHTLHSNANKNVLGKVKDECAGTPIAECVCLRPKMYSILKADEKNIKKAKGVKKSVVKKQIKHEQYKETLLGSKQLWHGMNIIRSEGHEIYDMHANKISLSPFDSKRWIADDGIHTNAYGDNPPLEITDAEIAAAEEALSELLRPPAAEQQLEFTDAEITAIAAAEKVLSELTPEALSELLRPPAAEQQLEFTDAEITANAAAEKVLSELPPEELSKLLGW